MADDSKIEELIDRISDHGRDYERLGMLSDEEVSELVELEAQMIA